jgi:sensor domain CHASE-containing protein
LVHRAFDVEYESGAEFVRRLSVWADNEDRILRHNAGNHSSYTLGHNAFSHLSLDEFHQRI